VHVESNGQGPSVLTVLAEPRLRQMAVREITLLLGQVAFQHAFNATDAVIALLSKRFDLVLVDSRAAGDLLPALKHHVRRVAPGAKLIVQSIRAHGKLEIPPAATGWSLFEEDVIQWCRTWIAGKPNSQ
jgi:predicted O-methyltransferase YrrM